MGEDRIPILLLKKLPLSAWGLGGRPLSGS